MKKLSLVFLLVSLTSCVPVPFDVFMPIPLEVIVPIHRYHGNYGGQRNDVYGPRGNYGNYGNPNHGYYGSHRSSGGRGHGRR